jgi:hypothetical protein
LIVMQTSVKAGVLVGTAMHTPLFLVVFGYQAQMPAWLPYPYLAPMLAPVLAWVGIETAARLHRPRWLSRLLLLPGIAGAGLWWWWLQDLIAWRNTYPPFRYGIPTLVVAAVIAAAVHSGRRNIRHDREDRDRETEPVAP